MSTRNRLIGWLVVDRRRQQVLALVLSVCVGFSAGLQAAPLDEQGPARQEPGLDLKSLEDFTETVFSAIERLHADHIKPVRKGELTRWAVLGLYQAVAAKAPDQVASTLSRSGGLKEQDLRALLSEARKHLGRRRRLDDLRDIDVALKGIFDQLEPDATQIPQREARDWAA